ncbi:unnamed protein product [Linum trigynum]|uniref:Uncharacterized protein n=1 Tax=Linum trigynum TaxID=586398 RepID=A0AAV2GP19_9ROSI
MVRRGSTRTQYKKETYVAYLVVIDELLEVGVDLGTGHRVDVGSEDPDVRVVLLSHSPPYSFPMFLLFTLICGSTGLGLVGCFFTGSVSLAVSIFVVSSTISCYCCCCCCAETVSTLLLLFLNCRLPTICAVEKAM